MPQRFSRKNFLVFLICILCVLLLVRIFSLQIYQSGKYKLLSDKNRIRTILQIPKRGRIITSDGMTIAENIYKYKLVAEYSDNESFQNNINMLSKYISFNDHEIDALSKLRKKARMYRMPIVLKDELSWEKFAKISSVMHQLTNVTVVSEYGRYYHLPKEFSHVLGYSATGNDQAKMLIGKTGIEYSLNDILSGKSGTSQVEVNSTGEKVRVLLNTPPLSGNDIIISINANIQKYVYDLLSNETAGACVVLNAETGEAIALVSYPGFDLNVVSHKMTPSAWNEINSNHYHPFLNRIIKATYPPGSIFKIVVALAALEEGIISKHDKICCTGHVTQDNSKFHCWNRSGHGNVNITDAIRLSCDCYFFEIAKRLGIDKIAKYAKMLGYGSESGLEFFNENRGLIPTKEWKLQKYGSSWKTYETMIAGIGQGAVLSNLAQSANMFGKIYTNNKNFKATLLCKNTSLEKDSEQFNENSLRIIKDALARVCIDGTASRSCNTEYGISGKTGSSQVRTLRSGEAGIRQDKIAWKYRDHALFVGVAPSQKPKYIVAVIIEHGGGGSSVAAPIARKIFDKLMSTYSNDQKTNNIP